MPYIKHDRRKNFEMAINDIVDELGYVDNGPESLDVEYDETLAPGDLNYIISSIIKRYIKKHGEKYYRYNYLIGALECAKLEAYRQQIANYEQQAINKNGDI